MLGRVNGAVPRCKWGEQSSPPRQTDISLEAKDKERKIVIEAKYYKKVFQEQKRFESHRKIYSPNLYQIFAYLRNLEKKGGMNRKCEGILLYPTVDEEVDLLFHLPDHQVRVKTLNLNQNWNLIHNELISIIN